MLLQADGNSRLATRISAVAVSQYSAGKISSPGIPVRCRAGGLAVKIAFNERMGFQLWKNSVQLLPIFFTFM